MLLSTRNLEGYALRATDGDLGKIVSVLFDDHAWKVRYLVVQTPRWFGKRVLVAPAVVGRPDASAMVVPVELSKQQVEDAPLIDTDRPVSRQQEASLAQYYGWPTYWTEPMGVSPPLAPTMNPAAPPPERREREPEHDPHLRSSHELRGYHVRGSDGDVGKVDDFVFELDGWRVRYVVVDTGGWLQARKVLVAPEWLRDIRWEDRLAEVDLTRGQVESSPEFDPSRPVNREYEARLYDYYGRPVYWS